MNFKQLELELELVLEDAAENPLLADVHSLWQQIEPFWAQLAIQEQLQLGGRAIEQLAELHWSKAQSLLDDWESTHDPQDPALPSDWLQGLVRQTQHVDLSELTAPVKRKHKAKPTDPKSDEETVVGTVPKENILKMLDQVELAEQKAASLAVAHEERVQDWVAEITVWFQTNPQPIYLLQLREQLGWPLVQLWLCLLLGGFKLEVVDQYFYSLNILVSTASSKA
jgi:hypothetical protein